MFLNAAAFNLFVQSMHSYGTKVAAAVTIAFNWDLVAFLPMLGMGHAVTALVGQNVGAGNMPEARKSTFTGLKTAWVYSGSMVLIFVFGARALVNVFLPGLEDGGAGVAPMAITMLRLASLYILADSAQLVFVGALRGAGDTRWVMIVSVALHWLFAGAALVLIKVLRVDPVISWVSFICIIIIMGITYFFRFRGGKWENIRMIDRGREAPDYRYSSGACPETMNEEPLE
jgi:MATE family multidrug resistance protein